MNRTATKFITAGIVLVAAVSYLAYAGMKEGWVSYHLQVDEYLASIDVHRNQRVRLVGLVAEEGLVSQPGRLSARFTMTGATGSVNVSYKGVIPDLFKAGVEVVVEGRSADASGVFQADLLMTKCASKYDAAGGEGHEGGHRNGNNESMTH
jgi:cytochrome c-type biogenesis protein CcmE